MEPKIENKKYELLKHSSIWNIDEEELQHDNHDNQSNSYCEEFGIEIERDPSEIINDLRQIRPNLKRHLDQNIELAVGNKLKETNKNVIKEK